MVKVICENCGGEFDSHACKSTRYCSQDCYSESRLKRLYPEGPNFKLCGRCEELKPVESFCKDSNRPDGLGYWCFECRKNHAKQREYNPEKERDSKLRKQYGLTLETYKYMCKAQNYECAICGRTPKDDGSGQAHTKLVVDHNHKSGAVRGLICAQCNTAIGLLQDNISTVLKLADYLYLHSIQEESNIVFDEYQGEDI